MDTNYINLKLTSNEQILRVGKGYPFRLLSIDGLTGGEITLGTTGNILSDGSRVKTKRLSFRPITIEIEYNGQDKARQRDIIAGFFNVHNGGILEVNLMGTERQINYEVEKILAPLTNLYEPFKFLVHLYCKDPYFEDTKENTTEVANWIGGLKFATELPTEFATKGDDIVNVINKGNVETPLTIEINGSSTNPKIINRSTGEFIRVLQKVEVGEKLVITTGFGNKRVELDGVNKFQYIDLESTFFSLKVGDNLIDIISENTLDNARVRIIYKNRYLGV